MNVNFIYPNKKEINEKKSITEIEINNIYKFIINETINYNYFKELNQLIRVLISINYLNDYYKKFISFIYKLDKKKILNKNTEIIFEFILNLVNINNKIINIDDFIKSINFNLYFNKYIFEEYYFITENIIDKSLKYIHKYIKNIIIFINNLHQLYKIFYIIKEDFSINKTLEKKKIVYIYNVRDINFYRNIDSIDNTRKEKYGIENELLYYYLNQFKNIFDDINFNIKDISFKNFNYLMDEIDFKIENFNKNIKELNIYKKYFSGIEIDIKKDKIEEFTKKLELIEKLYISLKSINKYNIIELKNIEDNIDKIMNIYEFIDLLSYLHENYENIKISYEIYDNYNESAEIIIKALLKFFEHVLELKIDERQLEIYKSLNYYVLNLKLELKEEYSNKIYRKNLTFVIETILDQLNFIKFIHKDIYEYYNRFTQYKIIFTNSQIEKNKVENNIYLNLCDIDYKYQIKSKSDYIALTTNSNIFNKSQKDINIKNDKFKMMDKFLYMSNEDLLNKNYELKKFYYHKPVDIDLINDLFKNFIKKVNELNELKELNKDKLKYDTILFYDIFSVDIYNKKKPKKNNENYNELLQEYYEFYLFFYKKLFEELIKLIRNTNLGGIKYFYINIIDHKDYNNFYDKLILKINEIIDKEKKYTYKTIKFLFDI